eukprot:1159622-Pelagomonas_calceolata.AAC.13
MSGRLLGAGVSHSCSRQYMLKVSHSDLYEYKSQRIGLVHGTYIGCKQELLDLRARVNRLCFGALERPGSFLKAQSTARAHPEACPEVEKPRDELKAFNDCHNWLEDTQENMHSPYALLQITCGASMGERCSSVPTNHM